VQTTFVRENAREEPAGLVDLPGEGSFGSEAGSLMQLGRIAPSDNCYTSGASKGRLIMPSVIGDIRDKWISLGGPQSFLGNPLTDETPTPDGRGRFNHFEGGSIYWTPTTGAHEVHGAIRDKWASMGWERSSLGYPLSDETPTSDGVGRFNNFQRGQIAWSPAKGAVVHPTHPAQKIDPDN
jgi:uncharacterized protein with LGFP repeats